MSLTQGGKSSKTIQEAEWPSGNLPILQLLIIYYANISDIHHVVGPVSFHWNVALS